MQSKELAKIEKQKKLWLTASFILAFFIIFLGYLLFSYKSLLWGGLNFSQFPQVQPQRKEEAQCLNCVRRNLDGVYVQPGEENLPPLALIIDNLIEAGPPSGLSRASLVYEAEAEGNITRFLAVFDSGLDIEKIGPVRSARDYFIDWAAELSALFVHCGGSPQALAKIVEEDIFNLNEFYQGDFFWRAKGKEAPHNIYTSSENLKRYLMLRKVREGKFLSWQFKNDIPLRERPESAAIEINYLLPDYMVKWQYDKESNEYLRYRAGRIHRDALKREIRAKNVVIEYAEADVIDEELRLKMRHLGSGQAIVCLDGRCQEGEWRKEFPKVRTRFYKTNGEEFQLNAGVTWIEVVKPGYKVDYQ